MVSGLDLRSSPRSSIAMAVKCLSRASLAKAASFASAFRYNYRFMMKRRILVVEDEEKLRRVVELQLSSAGFDVDQAGTAEAALPRIDRADLILTDLRLPG